MTPRDVIRTWIQPTEYSDHEKLRQLGYWTDVNRLDQLYIVCKSHPRILWAIINSHPGFLSLELKGKRGLKAMGGVVVYLLALKRNHFRPELEKCMWEKLGKCANAVKMKDLSHEISQLCQSGVGRLVEQHTLRDLHQVERSREMERRRVVELRSEWDRRITDGDVEKPKLRRVNAWKIPPRY